MELLLETGNIILGYDLGMDLILDGIVLCGKSECIPAHGEKNVISLHTALSCNNIKSCVGTGMSYMKTLSRRIGELNKRIIFGLGIIVRCGKGFLIIPYLLPLGLYLVMIIN